MPSWVLLRRPRHGVLGQALHGRYGYFEFASSWGRNSVRLKGSASSSFFSLYEAS